MWRPLITLTDLEQRTYERRQPHVCDTSQHPRHAPFLFLPSGDSCRKTNPLLPFPPSRFAAVLRSDHDLSAKTLIGLVIRLATASALLLLPTQAVWAHTEVGVPGGLASGFLHPLTGLDHVNAMVSVVLWARCSGRRRSAVLPITFPLVMATGGVFGIMDVPVPQPELMIALSAVVLGLAVAFRARRSGFQD